MHPILANRRRLIAYLLAWIPLTGLLVVLLARSGPSPWEEAVAMGIPLGLLLAFMCLASFYPTRSVPLAPLRVGRLVGVHAGATTLSVGLWLLAAANLAAMYGQLPHFAGIEERFLGQAPVLAGVGALLYLLATAGHALVLAVQASEQHARRALEAKLAARQAELDALRAQLDPHFLFNALNSISSLASSEPEAAREMCVRLASFLRGSLRLAGPRTIPLRDELSLARDYLAVEQARFGARLHVHLDVNDAALDVAVPPLVLQPLVENAVTHGIAQQLEGGTIRIEGRRHGDHLTLVVENPCPEDGSGQGGLGVGLANVRRRLAAAFGENAHLTARRTGGHYRVELSLPVGDPPAPPPGTLPSVP
ncbi:MAG: histidine kinase [Acidobacteriota bacterium]|jgi:hypothetical protein